MAPERKKEKRKKFGTKITKKEKIFNRLGGDVLLVHACAHTHTHTDRTYITAALNRSSYTH
jgi:hypothetical protein